MQSTDEAKKFLEEAINTLLQLQKKLEDNGHPLTPLIRYNLCTSKSYLRKSILKPISFEESEKYVRSGQHPLIRKLQAESNIYYENATLVQGERAHVGGYGNLMQMLSQKFSKQKIMISSEKINTSSGDGKLYQILIKYKLHICRYITEQLGTVTRYITVGYYNEYPCIMIKISRETIPPASINSATDASFNSWVDCIASYFIGLINYCSFSNNIPIEMERRASFGFLSPTVACTDDSIRINVGIIPKSYANILTECLKILDHVLTQKLDLQAPLHIPVFYTTKEYYQYLATDSKGNQKEVMPPPALNTLSQLLWAKVDTGHKSTLFNITRTPYAKDGIASQVFNELLHYGFNPDRAFLRGFYWSISQFQIILNKKKPTLAFAQNDHEMNYGKDRNGKKIGFSDYPTQLIDTEFWTVIDSIVTAVRSLDDPVLDSVIRGMNKCCEKMEIDQVFHGLEILNELIFISSMEKGAKEKIADGYGSDSDDEEDMNGSRICTKKIIVHNGMRAIFGATLATYNHLRDQKPSISCRIFLQNMYYETADGLTWIMKHEHLTGIGMVKKSSEGNVIMHDLNGCVTNGRNTYFDLPAERDKILILDTTSTTAETVHEYLKCFANSRAELLFLVDSGLKNQQLGADKNQYGTVRIYTKNKQILNKIYAFIKNNERPLLSPISHHYRRTMKKIGVVPTARNFFNPNSSYNVVEVLLEIIKNKSDRVRQNIVHNLLLLRSENSKGFQTIVDQLIHLSSSARYHERCNAARALAFLAELDDKLIDILVKRCEGGKTQFEQESAIFALGKLALSKLQVRTDYIIASLLFCLDNQEPWIRYYAADALVNLGQLNLKIIDILLDAADEEKARIWQSVGDPDEGEYEPFLESPQIALSNVGIYNLKIINEWIVKLENSDFNSKNLTQTIETIGNSAIILPNIITHLLHPPSKESAGALDEQNLIALENLGKIQKMALRALYLMKTENDEVTKSLNQSIEKVLNSFRTYKELLVSFSVKSNRMKLDCQIVSLLNTLEEPIDTILKARLISYSKPTNCYNIKIILKTLISLGHIDWHLANVIIENGNIYLVDSFEIDAFKNLEASKEAIELLINGLTHESLGIRFNATTLLGKINYKYHPLLLEQVIQKLWQNLYEEEELWIYYNVANSLFNLGEKSEEITDVLIEALYQGHPAIQFDAASKLIQLGMQHPNIFFVCINWIDSSLSEESAAKAQEILKSLGIEEYIINSIEILKKIFGYQDYLSVVAQYEGIPSETEKLDLYLNRYSFPRFEKDIALILASSRSERIEKINSILIKALKSVDPYLKSLALEVVNNMDSVNDEFMKILSNLLHDPIRRIRLRAAEALVCLKSIPQSSAETSISKKLNTECATLFHSIFPPPVQNLIFAYAGYGSISIADSSPEPIESEQDKAKEIKIRKFF